MDSTARLSVGFPTVATIMIASLIFLFTPELCFAFDVVLRHLVIVPETPIFTDHVPTERFVKH